MYLLTVLTLNPGCRAIVIDWRSGLVPFCYSSSACSPPRGSNVALTLAERGISFPLLFLPTHPFPPYPLPCLCFPPSPDHQARWNQRKSKRRPAHVRATDFTWTVVTDHNASYASSAGLHIWPNRLIPIPIPIPIPVLLHITILIRTLLQNCFILWNLVMKPTPGSSPSSRFYISPCDVQTPSFFVTR